MISRRSFISGLTLVPALASSARLLAQPAPNRLHALVIGNDNYGSIRKLERAAADARSVSAKVKGFGYEVVEAIDAGTDAMFAAFSTFRDRLRGGGAAFVYFAGHGLQVNGTNYLLPLDVDGSSDEKMLETSLPLSPLLDELARARPGQAIVMLDACRNNPVRADMPGLQQGFASIQAPGGFYIAYSAGSGELALDRLGPDDANPNGLFTRYLLNNLKPNRPIDDIMRDTRCQVANAADGIGHRQHPAIYDQAQFDLRLDARRDLFTGKSYACTIGTGRLQNTAVLLIANQEYQSRTHLANLATPRSDARRLEKTFKSLGAKTLLLEDVGLQRIREACTELAAGGHDRIIVYYAGMGELVANEAAMFLVDPAAPVIKGNPAQVRAVDAPKPLPSSATKSAMQGMEGLDCLFLGDMVNDLRPPPPKADAKKKTRGFVLGPVQKSGVAAPPAPPPVRLVMLLDFCLASIDIGLKPRRASVLQTLQAGWETYYDHVAVITGGGLFQSVLDAAEGQSKSPFAIGLDNALARPGLSVGQFAELVRDEVDDLTKGYQTPAFFANPDRRGDPLVERVAPLASKSKPS